jgi:hypothetical protein
MKNRLLLCVAAAAALWLGAPVAAVAQHDDGHIRTSGEKMLTIPESLRIEHQELHEELAAASNLPGRTGAAARRVATLLQPHFASEEEYALPPLGLLPALASAGAPAGARDVIAMSDKLKANLPRMLEEHKAIVRALDDLVAAAKDENHPDAMDFAGKLTLHAQTEEQVLYPAAILVGEYVKKAAR